MRGDGTRSATRRSRFWLIAKRGGGATKVFAIEGAGGEKTLPVFSFEEEAQLYLRLGDLGPGWLPEEK